MLGVTLGTLGITLAYAAAFLPQPLSRAAPWLMAAGVTLLLVALLRLGARAPGGGRGGWLRFVLWGIGGLLLGAFAAALLLPAESAATPLWLGLPRRAAMLVYGVGLVPAVVLPLAYGLSFRTTVLSEAELERLRARLEALRRESSE